MSDKAGIKAFFRYAKERYAIYHIRMVGVTAPWTLDPILQKYRFCNVYRELDATTIWFREHIRDPLRNDPHLSILSTVAFRWFNKVSTWQTILNGWEGAGVEDIFDEWDSEEIDAVLRRDGSSPWVTGAYMIKTPANMDKVTGVLSLIDEFYGNHLGRLVDAKHTTLQGFWRDLTAAPYMGDFMAYEVVTDLRHTCVLESATDIDTWANPGPGACRGYGRVTGEGVDRYNRNKPADCEEVIRGMRTLLRVSRLREFWPQQYPVWELREVEHTLCEFDKYERVRLGEGRPKQLYRRGA